MRYEIARQQAWQVGIDTHQAQGEQALATLENLMEHLLIRGLERSNIDSWAKSFMMAAKPGYFGSPEVIGQLVSELVSVCIEEAKDIQSKGTDLIAGRYSIKPIQIFRWWK